MIDMPQAYPMQVALFVFLVLFVGLVLGAVLAWRREQAAVFRSDAEPWQELWQVLAALATFVLVLVVLTACRLADVGPLGS